MFAVRCLALLRQIKEKSHTMYILSSPVTSTAIAVQPAESSAWAGSRAVCGLDVGNPADRKIRNHLRGNPHPCLQKLSSALPCTVSRDMLLQLQASCAR